MSEYKAVTTFIENMSFDSVIDGHTIRLDTGVAAGGNDSGVSPKKLLLSGLAGCTGMDVVSLLRKMRVAFSDFSIVTEADLTTGHPKVFAKVSIDYRIKVAEGDKDKMEKAVHLSKERYCGVSAMLAKNSPIDFKITYL